MPLDVLLGRDHLVIAEIAQAHDGNLDVAHELIDSAARAGAHAVKFGVPTNAAFLIKYKVTGVASSCAPPKLKR